MTSEQRITLSFSSVLLVLVAIPAFILLWKLRSLLLLVMISVVLACSISPAVDWAERYRVPRWLSALLAYLILLGGLVGVGLLIGPTIIEQIERLVRQVPVSLRGIIAQVEVWVVALNDTRPELTGQVFDQVDVQALVGWVIRSSQQLVLRSFNVTTDIVGSFFSVILALFISTYMLADSRTLTQNLIRLLPYPWDERLEPQLGEVSQRIGGYIRGRLLVSSLLAVIISLSLSLIGLKDFAIGLGAIAGVTNLIPFLGPILGAIPALAVAIPQGGWIVLWVIILYAIIQNLETYLLDPLLVGSAVGVHPLYQLLAVLGGTQVLGIIGALIVPPWVAGGAVILENLYLRPKLRAERQQRRDLSRLAVAAGSLTPETDSVETSITAGNP
ncbi:AI-2E family transporter [Romeria aff. gracilis LEGE 07310]|uniref:AI-2E family transporter n=1 Tax=Vasconcelosia minhoensis LEGE 07310 TaxID=915328 RepID=A0A8J7AVT1_9CYAN|nr:AI-2E family transporter [Romeria gracilis]MBE9077943.1 AI-2E family transporter [Romeria aff. gracilis LEGE 07310]